MSKITLEALIKLTPQSVMNRVNNCLVSLKEVSIKTDNDGNFKHCLGIVKSDSVPRNVEIKLYNPEMKNHAKCYAYVWCSCEYFTYTCEVANARRQASKIVLSNGQAPNETNPDERPHLCKHLVAFSKIAIKSTPTNLKQVQDKLRKEQYNREQEKKQLEFQFKNKQPAMPKSISGIPPIKLPKPMEGIKPIPGIGSIPPSKKSE